MENSNNWGGKRANSGRPAKEKSQELIENLRVFTDDTLEVLHKSILEGKSWAVKLWFERMYGKVTEYKDINFKTVDEVPRLIRFVSQKEIENEEINNEK